MKDRHHQGETPRSEGTGKKRVLLVEDERSLVRILTDRLASEGYAVDSARDGESALALAAEKSFDLIILDLMLPGRDGLDVCRDLRQQGHEMPILMLTARSQVVDKVVGLKLGADDYLTKPFEMIELLARLEALLRRSRRPLTQPPESYDFGNIRVDLRRAEVTLNGAPVALSGLELKLLRHFIEHRGAVLSRDQLLDRVWGYNVIPNSRTVDVHVASLRQKLERNPSKPELIVTVYGIGYKFVG